MDLPTAGEDAARRRLDTFLEKAAGRYHEDRDLPAVDGTSRLSPYLRCGAISVRDCFERAREAAAEERPLAKGVGKWLDELVWREFYAAILEEHPRVLGGNYRREYDSLVWNDDAEGFLAWCEGRTGYPIVDAGMRQLRSTGWMHNRVRMIVASFLTKDLLIDWREGERFFYEWLVDGDPASNNGGWQWAASTGTDAQPFFRIFNPVSQGQRWDPDGAYVRRYVPELADVPDDLVHRPWEAGSLFSDYPPPIVDHAERREEALARYREAREGAS
jgi:deoxyribodipyrimidine photo-lyase